MNSKPDGARPSWRDLPKLSFSRGPAPAKGKRDSSDFVYDVRSADTLGAEFDNRKLKLAGTADRKVRR